MSVKEKNQNINQTVSDNSSSMFKTEAKTFASSNPKNKVLEKIKRREATHFDPMRVLIIVLLFASLTIISVFRKDKPLDDVLHIPKCGFIDWTLFLL